MDNDTIYFKVAADLSQMEPQFEDFSKFWQKYNDDVAKGEKAINNYTTKTAKAYEAVNKKIKANISEIAAEGKALKDLENKFKSLQNANEKSFDDKELLEFNESLKKVNENIKNLDQFDISAEDFEFLTKQLSTAQDDFEALNVLVDFFENKMKGAASQVSDSFDVIKKKIEETKLNISSTEDFLKDIDKQIKSTAPGQDQANLIAERRAAEQALKEEKVALADYTTQLKMAREENVSMATQLRKVKDELVALELAGGRGSDRWVELRDKAEEYNDAISNTNKELRRASSSTEGLDNLIGAATGIVGVFTAAQGAASLFGDENEDLEESLIKLNGAIALLNGLQAIQTELTKKETIAGRALTAVKAQYAVATNAGAAANVRFAATLKLLGIGLLVGLLALAVVYWKDIAEAIGLVNREKESLVDINKKSIESTGNEIGRLRSLQGELKNANTSISRQKEIKQELLDQYPGYLKALGDEKASAEDIETAFNNLNKALLLNAKITAARELLSEEFKKVLEAERKALEGEATTYQTVLNSLSNINFDPKKAEAGFTEDNRKDSQKNLNDAKKDFDEFESFISQFIVDTNNELEKLGGDPTKDGDKFKANIKAYEQFSDLLKDLIDEQENYRINAIEDSREREKEILRNQLQDEKQKYAQEINDLKISQERKLKLIEEFNKLYNEKTGLAYEELRKKIAEIDDKYNAELESVQFKALQAIDSILISEANNDRQAIQDRWDAIRDEINDQIKKTNDAFKKAGLEAILVEIDIAENKELDNFDLNVGLDRVDRERDIAEAILKIQQNNINDIVRNEKLKQLQLLNLEKEYFNQVLQTYEDSFKSIQDKGLFNDLTSTLVNSINATEIQEAADALREKFGDDIAEEILKTAEALREVKKEINDISKSKKINETVDEWIASFDAFSNKLTEVILKKFPDIVEQTGVTAEEFAQSLSSALSTTYNAIEGLLQANVDSQRERVNAVQENIDTIEAQLDRERQLYEDGYANNYELRQKDLENLKAQKKKEEEELKKAQKQRAALAKAELLIDTVSQLSNLVTAAANIFKWASKIPFVGVPLAIGLIGTMFGAFTLAKVKAFQAIGQGQNFRKGLREGPVQLDGPSHERGGYGVYDSESGKKVAEFEGREKVYVMNQTQELRYGRIMKYMIDAEKGGKPMRDAILDHYNIPKTGKETMKVITGVNKIAIKAEKAKELSSRSEEELLSEMKKLNKNFEKEFGGYRVEREDNVKTWETPEYFYVKQGNKTKKYPKNKDAS